MREPNLQQSRYMQYIPCDMYTTVSIFVLLWLYLQFALDLHGIFARTIPYCLTGSIATIVCFPFYQWRIGKIDLYLNPTEHNKRRNMCLIRGI